MPIKFILCLVFLMVGYAFTQVLTSNIEDASKLLDLTEEQEYVETVELTDLTDISQALRLGTEARVVLVYSH